MSKPTLTEKLEQWVAGGGCLIGEVSIDQTDVGYRLVHRLDGDTEELERFSSPVEARGIVRYDESGEYRPMKSAPGLRRGWELFLNDAGALREALDYFYPAVVGTWFANEQVEIEAIPLRAVLSRQTGMYRFANNVSDDGAQTMVAKDCGAGGGCLKRVCWGLNESEPITSLPEEEISREVMQQGEMPMLCVEACNWLVAKARKASADEFQASQAE